MEFGGGVVVEWWLSKITKVKEKRLSEDHQPDESHVVPLYERLVLTTHGLIEISDLGETLMLFCEFPKTTTIYIYCYEFGSLLHTTYRSYRSVILVSTCCQLGSRPLSNG